MLKVKRKFGGKSVIKLHQQPVIFESAHKVIENTKKEMFLVFCYVTYKSNWESLTTPERCEKHYGSGFSKQILVFGCASVYRFKSIMKFMRNYKF